MGRIGSWLGLGAWVTLAGCSHEKGELRDWVFRGERAAFRMGPLPAAWQRVSGQAAAEFFHPGTGAAILADANCQDDKDAPLTVLANTLLIGFTERRVQSERRLAMAGREALRSVTAAKLDGVPVLVESYVLKKDGCVYDLVYVTPPDRYEEGASAFEHFRAGFWPLPMT